MSCVHEFSLRSPNAYFGLEPCFARKQTMLAGYEDSMLCSHVLACAAGLRRHLIPCERGEPAAVPYPGVRPRKRGRPAHALLACAAGLRRHLIPCERGEPAAVPYPGVRPCKRGRRRLYISKCKRGRRRLYISPAGAGRRPCYMLYCTGLLF